jgi:hypothetical protein
MVNNNQEYQYPERPFLCSWKIVVNHVDEFDKIEGIEKCFKCNGHDLLCKNYINSDALNKKQRGWDINQDFI